MVVKRGRILGIVIFIFNISFKNDSYVFVKIVQREPLYEAIGRKFTMEEESNGELAFLDTFIETE